MASKSNSRHEAILKEYYSPYIYDCLKKHYNTGRYGYVILIGGEAINHYLPKANHVPTSDFDLKFVVNREYTDDEHELSRANVKRLQVLTAIKDCLSKVKPPKGYSEIYPKLVIKHRNREQLVYVEDNRLYRVDPMTGEEKFTFYKVEKNFSVILYYKPISSNSSKSKTKPQEFQTFAIVDLGLYYRKTKGYSYFATTIYDSFMKPPFNGKISIPFKAFDNVRVPTPTWMLFDNYRMTLISLDNLNMHKDEPEIREFWKNKLKKYWQKIDTLLDYLKKDNQVNQLENVRRAMKTTYALYEPLAHTNMQCFREGFVYTPKMLEKTECTPEYKAKLTEFEGSYYDVAELVSKLRY